MKVMCHRPRTQRIGEDSMPRELMVFKGTEKQCRQALRDIRKSHRKMVEAGYPWSGGKYRNFQTQPNDEFYLRIDT